MKFSPTAAVVALLALGSTTAFAQDATVQGSGYQLSERTVLHPTIGAETGYVSNVFYQENSELGAGLLNIHGTVAISPVEDLSDKGGTPADVTFEAGARFTYQEFLSGNDDITSQRNLGLGADLLLGLMPASRFPISFEDHFIRTNRPTNFESSDTLSRDINSFKAGIAYKPVGRNISGRFHYANTIDIFESTESSFANRLLNEFQLGVDWQFLPITRFYLQGSYGLNSGLGSESTKVSSTPIRGMAGVATAITESITMRAHAGYALGSYSTGASYSTFIYHLEGGYRYSPVGRVTLSIDRDFKDSINANFYGDYTVKLAVDQQVDRVMLEANAATHLRNYEGVDMLFAGGATRSDLIFASQLTASLELKDWLSVNASYELAIDQTDYRSMVGGEVDDPSYVRHQAMAGATASF